MRACQWQHIARKGSQALCAAAQPACKEGQFFKDSPCQLNCFRKSVNLKNVLTTGEAAHANEEVTKACPKQIKEHRGDLSEQVFNADKTDLFGGKNAQPTCVLREARQGPDLKDAEDYVVLGQRGLAFNKIRLAIQGCQSLCPKGQGTTFLVF